MIEEHFIDTNQRLLYERQQATQKTKANHTASEVPATKKKA